MSQKFVSSRLVHLLCNLILAISALTLILILAVPIGFYGMAMYLAPNLPSVSEIKTAHLEMPLQIYSKDNKLVGQYGNRMSLPVTYDEVPKNLTNAFLAAEDSSFFEHSGISIKGLGRAVTEIITHDEGQTGGSTITMQVAKNYFLTPDRTFNRKLTELYLARRIEDKLTKNEILTLYVNKIYMGEGAYGIKAAARKYFSKSLNDLTIAEMATLAGLPKAPSQNNPVSNPTVALDRRNWILGRMKALGYINEAEYDEAIHSPLEVHVYQEKFDVDMPYLAEMARHELVSKYGEAVVNSGWRVKLTVSSQAQSAAEAAVREGINKYDLRHGWRGVEASGKPLSNFITLGKMVPAKVTEVDTRSFKAQLKNGDIVTVPWSGMSWARKFIGVNSVGSAPNRAADIVNKDDIVRLVVDKKGTGWRLTQLPKVQGSLVALDPETGAVKSLVGGFDYRYSKFNRATQGWRQPGSTIKPLVYSAALEKGYRPDSLISDSPLQVGDWKPKNSDGRFYGPITLRRGLYLSRNLVSIRLLQSIGTTDARHLLDQFGLDKEKLPTTLSLALGAGQTTPLQMATAYATFANGGHRIQPYYIDQIFDYNNNLLYMANPQRACALCFNKNLEKVNTDLQDEFIKHVEAESKLRETALKLLQENPNILATLDNKFKEAAILDSENDTETEESDSIKEVATDEEEKAATLDEMSNNKALKEEIYTLQYSGSPGNDRLKPSLVQYNVAKQAPRILKPLVAFEMADILRDVIRHGTGRRALVLGRDDIGGKTGTTNEMKDAWFAGFHPTLATIVWMGFDQPASLGRSEYGGVAALPVWIDYMGQQLKDVPLQWVSVNNKAKSEKQNQDVINLTNETIAKDDSKKKSTKKTSKKPAQSSRKPPTPNVSKREPPPEPTPEENNETAPSQQSNPLTVNKVKELPPL